MHARNYWYKYTAGQEPVDLVSEGDGCQRPRARTFSFPVAGGWLQMSSLRYVSALGAAVMRTVLFIGLCCLRGQFAQEKGIDCKTASGIGGALGKEPVFSSSHETICLSLFAFSSLGNSFFWLLSLSVSSKLGLALGLDLSQFSNAWLYFRMYWMRPSSLISLSSLSVLISEDWFRRCFCTIFWPRVLCYQAKLWVGSSFGYSPSFRVPGEMESGGENLVVPPIKSQRWGLRGLWYSTP